MHWQAQANEHSILTPDVQLNLPPDGAIFGWRGGRARSFSSCAVFVRPAPCWKLDCALIFYCQLSLPDAMISQ